jgi:hypothetical protein
MSKIFRIAITAFMVAMTFNVAATNGAFSQTPDHKLAARATPGQTSGGGHVYLLRGLLNIFSLGMDDLAAKLQSRGISAAVYEYGNWESLCQDAATRYRAGRGPIILVGHSLGADAVIYMSNRLGQMGVPVALIVAFDPVHPVPLTGGSTARFVNYYQSDNGWGRAIPRGAGFRGDLNNIDLRKHTEISHTTIDKSAQLHAAVIGRVQGVLGKGGGSKPAGVGAPVTGSTPSAPSRPLTPTVAGPTAPTPPSTGAALQPAPETLRPVISPSSRTQTQ